MHKIKDNGRTLKAVKLMSCYKCALQDGDSRADCQCDSNKMWRETIPSRISRFIKRIVRK